MKFPSPVLPFSLPVNASIVVKRENGFTVDNRTGNEVPIYETLTLSASITRTEDKNKQFFPEGANEQLISVRGYLINPPDGWTDYKFDGVLQCSLTALDTGAITNGELMINGSVTPFLESFAAKGLYPFWGQFKQVEGWGDTSQP